MSAALPPREPHPVRTYRDRHGIAMKDFAQKVGISVASLWRIEQGEVECPNLGIISRMALAAQGRVSECDIFRYHCAAATGIVPPLHAPITSDFSWGWVRPPAGRGDACL